MKLITDSTSPGRIKGHECPSLPEILVIDDDIAFQKLLTKSFSPSLKVESALSGQGGLDLIKDPARNFCCVLLDYQLPGVDGVSVLNQIRELDSKIPVLFMTGFGDPDLVEHALQLGANEYIPKPALPSALFAAISNWVPDIPQNDRLAPPPVEQPNESGNRFTARKADGTSLFGKVVRFGSRTVVIEPADHPGWQDLKAVDLSNIEMKLGRFSMAADSAVIRQTEFPINRTLEISLPDLWQVETEEDIDSVTPATDPLPSGLRSAVSDMAAFLIEMQDDLDALENHIEDWPKTERAQIEKTFIAQMEKDYFPALDAGLARFEREAGEISPKLDAAIAPKIREALYPLVLASPILSRIIEKPIGIPGDYGMLGQILGNRFEGHSLYSRTINGWVLNSGAADAYRYRVDFLTHQLKKIVRQVNQQGRRAKVLSIGSGVAYEVQRHIAACGDSSVDFNLFDFSSETLKEAKRLIDLCYADSKTETVRVDIRQGSVIDLISKSRSGRAEFKGMSDFDFVYCIGLFDYLSDRLCCGVTGYLSRLAGPQGRVAVSNFTPNNPLRRFMDLVLDWQLIYRTEDQFAQIVEKSNPGTASWSSVFEEPGGAEVYGMIGKQG